MPGPLAALAHEDPQPGAARDREAYFVAAYQLLAEGGCEAVTMAALCERLNATPGSFYHHFLDLPTFVTVFAERWQQGALEWYATCAAVPHPLRRHELIVNQYFDVTVSGGESAIRAWALTEPALASAMAVVHQAADEMTIRTYEQIFGDRELAELLQSLAMCVVVGMSLRVEETADFGRLLRMSLEYTRRAVGIETELVNVDGQVQFRFIDGMKVDLPADPSWSSPGFRGLVWDDPVPATEETEPESTRRARGRADYFRAARELLAEQGFDGLTVDALCRRLEVTKSSFRHHFETMAIFLEALATHWADVHADHLAHLCQEPDPWPRLQLHLQHLLDRPDPAESAFRAWAHTEPVIGRALRRIDRTRQDAYESAVTGATGDPAADVLADGMLGLAIGLHQNPPGVDPDTATRIVLAFARRYLRVDAEVSVVNNRPVIVCRSDLGTPDAGRADVTAIDTFHPTRHGT